MVDLPSIANVVPQVRAPESRVSPAQIAAPYQQLASNLNKMGEVAEEVGTKLATREGEEAVSADGKTIAKPVIPILGVASAEFSRAARFTALGRMTPDIENRMAEIRIEHANDPKGFQDAAKAFQNSYVNGDEEKGLPPINDPALKGPVEKTILHQAGAGYRSVLEQTNQTNITNGKTTITSQISDLSNKMAQSAFTGGADSPDYKIMQGNLGALYQELGNDPRMGYPKARIESEVSEMTSQHKTMAIAGQAVRMMDGDDPNGRANAKKWLIDKVYGDQSLNLSLAQRHQAVTTAMGLMEARSSENKALIAANSQTVTTLLTQLHGNTPYNPITVNDAIANSAKVGDVEGYYKLTFAKGMHEWDSTVRSLPLPQQMAALKNLDTMRSTSSAASGEAMSFFVGKGYTREQAAGIVGNLIQESGLNPNTVHDNGTGLGIAGHRLERLDAMRQFAASKGKPVNDFQTQLEFIDQELQTTEGATGKALRAAKTPQEAATAFINFERPQGWTPENPQGGHGYSNRVANAVAVAGGSTGRAGEAWFNEARIEQVGRTREYLKTQAPDIVETTIARLNKTGDVPDADLKNVSDLLRETGRDDLRDKLNVSLLAHYGVKELDSLPTSVRQAWATQSTPQAASSNLAFKVHEHMASTIAANADAMQKTPYSTYAVRTQAQPPPAYNFDDPQSVGAVATMRAGLQKTIRNNDGTGPMSVFEGKEAEAFGSSLTNGDPAKAAQSLAGLAALPDDIYQATLAQKPIATAVAGMMSSKEPNRMTASMSAADKLWRANPADAKDALGDAAITKLQAWQGLKGSFNSAELAEKLNASEEPSTLAARKAAKEAAETETANLRPDDMAYKLGSSWGIPLVSRVANLVTGATPAAPFDSIKGGELVADYKATYTSLRAYGVDADKASDLAVQRLQSTWGVSQAAGNQVMKNPPERSYPAIDGNHDWLQADLTKWVTSKAGAEFSTGPRTLEAGFAGAGQSRNWNVAGLISDGQTQAEIAAGKPASYQVAIKKADGTLSIIPSRIAFDPSDHVTEHGARLEDRRRSVDFMRATQFSGPQP
jgi:hypothetical protein